MKARVNELLASAVAAGLLPADAALPQHEQRPWPVVLFSALGAWLAAIPLILMMGMLLRDLVSRGTGPYVIGPLLLAAAVIVLRARELPAFVEQLAIPALLTGGGTLALGLFRDLPDGPAAALLALIALVLAALIDRPWLRVLLGAAASGLALFALLPHGSRAYGRDEWSDAWLAMHGVLLPWLAAQAALARSERLPARLAAFIESTAAGWLLALLCWLAAWSGMSFLVAGSLGGGGLAMDIASEVAQQRRAFGIGWPVLQAGSALLALCAAGTLARAWPSLRRPVFAGVALLLAALAFCLPALGAASLALALCAGTQRWRLAAAAAVAVAWIIGSVYYQLQWPLATKALLLAGVGAGLGVLAFIARLRAQRVAPLPMPSVGRRAAALLAGGALATLAVVNIGIWQKESLIAQGRPVFVELAPVDPRSLMQGDYMRLNFNLPRDGLDGLLTLRRPHVVARRDARGVAALLRLDDGTPLAADEMRIELTPKDGRWILVSDAWFFKEGQAERWSAAKYGEFRVDDTGRALLVGMADAQLRPIRP
jgi:uncharacterized membrane-anchored protein